MLRKETDHRPHVFAAAVGEEIDLVSMIADGQMQQLFEITFVDDGEFLG